MIDGARSLLHVDRLHALWREHCDELLADWRAEHPGARPWAWWTFDAPEPRRQLGGRGVRMSERYANLVQLYEFGVPLFDSMDADDPPVFENESAYLDRLGLSD